MASPFPARNHPQNKNMKNYRSLSLVALLAIAGSVLAVQSDVTKSIQAIYSKLDALSIKKDIPGLTKLLKQNSTPDCAFIGKTDKSGKTEKKNRDETMAQMAGFMPFIDVVNVSTSHIDSVKMGKGSLVASVTSVVAMTLKKGQDGKVHKIVQNSKSQDTWVNVGGSWKLKVSKIVTESATQDGKAIPGS